MFCGILVFVGSNVVQASVFFKEATAAAVELLCCFALPHQQLAWML
jgi:hypothetical protein